MKVVHTLAELRSARKDLPEPVGLVPTMGYLHQGHLSLVQAAHKTCPSVAVSIFVNPTQFAPTEDLASYPRNLEKDLCLLEEAGVDLVWAPDEKTIYPDRFQTWVTVQEVTRYLEGFYRPEHFRGVTTIVAKLFNAVQPQQAFFGQKDAQQAVVIKQMVRDLNFPIDIVVCPIVREADGLALSSRNTYLSPLERQAATILNKALIAAEKAYLAGERDAERIRQVMHSEFQTEPLANVQYASCADPRTLQELETISQGALLSVAVYIGKTRLIDNLVLRETP